MLVISGPWSCYTYKLMQPLLMLLIMSVLFLIWKFKILAAKLFYKGERRYFQNVTFNGFLWKQWRDQHLKVAHVIWDKAHAAFICCIQYLYSLPQRYVWIGACLHTKNKRWWSSSIYIIQTQAFWITSGLQSLSLLSVSNCLDPIGASYTKSKHCTVSKYSAILMEDFGEVQWERHQTCCQRIREIRT